MKQCIKCKQMLPLDEFGFSKSRSRKRPWQRTTCKACVRAYAAKQRRRNPEKIRARVRRSRAKRKTRDPEAERRYCRNSELQNKYGITLQQYEQICEQQNGVCAICGLPPVKMYQVLHVDHDHTTGRIRGLLCGACNSGIGYLKDDPRILERAISYLQKGE